MIFEDDYFPERTDILVDTFLNKFGGRFGSEAVSAYIFYQDKNHNPYEVKVDTKTQFFDLMSQSIKEGRNLFLDYPFRFDLPEGAVI
jgi:hypothetical protein